MPELPTMEGRIPELKLPEISRDEIVRSLSEVRRPDFELPSIEWPKVDLSKIDVTREDVDKAILGVATAARLVRPAIRSSRLPLALGFLVVAALATFAILSRPAVRERLAIAAREAQRRVEDARTSAATLEIQDDLAFDGATPDAIAIPIEPDAFADDPAAIAEATTEPKTSAKKAAPAPKETPADSA
jgi:hypothetical protein